MRGKQRRLISIWSVAGSLNGGRNEWWDEVLRGNGHDLDPLGQVHLHIVSTWSCSSFRAVGGLKKREEMILGSR